MPFSGKRQAGAVKGNLIWHWKPAYNYYIYYMEKKHIFPVLMPRQTLCMHQGKYIQDWHDEDDNDNEISQGSMLMMEFQDISPIYCFLGGRLAESFSVTPHQTSTKLKV